VVNLIVPQLIATGKVPRPGIGISVLDEEMAARLGVVGVVVDRVLPGTAAEDAGLAGIDYRKRELGDVIVAADGRPVTNLAEFSRILEEFGIGETVEITVRNGDRERTVTVAIIDIS
jgi:2-alkenal reductase